MKRSHRRPGRHDLSVCAIGPGAEIGQAAVRRLLFADRLYVIVASSARRVGRRRAVAGAAIARGPDSGGD